jgi:magnesium-transporting ATPase (P-type)
MNGDVWAFQCVCFFATGWAYSGGSLASPKRAGKKETATILHRFQFTSALKRMAVIVKVVSPSNLVLCPKSSLPLSGNVPRPVHSACGKTERCDCLK